MRSSDWSSDVCSSDLQAVTLHVDRGAEVNYKIEPDVASGASPNVVFALKYSTNAKDEPEVLEKANGVRTRVVEGKSESVRVDLGGRRIIKKKTTNKRERGNECHTDRTAQVTKG